MPNEQVVEMMVDWFLDNYEDPAHGVPFESAEGGYQYFLGGPWDAYEVLYEYFQSTDFSENDVEEAARRLQHQSAEWVKKGVY